MPILDFRKNAAAPHPGTPAPGASVAAVLSALQPEPLFELLPIGLYTCTADGAIVRYNRRAAELWGHSPPAGDPHLRFCGAYRAYRRDGSALPPGQSPMAEALRSGQSVRDRELVFERPGGGRLVVLAGFEPIRDATGAVVGALGCLQDISALKHGHKALLNELNHRVKNALTSVQALASQTIRGRRSADDVRADFEARLFALNGAHTRLASSEWQEVDLRALLQDVLAAHQNDAGTRIALEGVAIALPPKTAVPLTMIVHELTTNALKFGALSVAQGRVSVSWRFDAREDGRHVEIDWVEQDGPPVRRPDQHGFGSRLIDRTVVHELQGIMHMSYGVEGVRCIVDFLLRDDPGLSRRTA